MSEDNLSAKEMLAEVDKAIYKVLVGGQSYKIGSRQLTRADLKMLNNMKNDLMAQVAQNESDLLDDTYIAVFSGR
ncbi:peptidylprolyl isomerase [Clostridium sp. M14]|uniref:peptidylprolyl isomerase n=1 Tax=Clostridium sp. M14 TaxID=2716311 RepID=UPI0013EE6ABC|nr:peptidylprolyl isomerase [Clostridium sp. M14]MBZ9691617.1 peptidylprolyl isomerase [Clostridium sp. M14]